MTIDAVCQFGVSLFASAGIAGIIVGLPPRPMLSNLIAGLQLAITQPIRLDDAIRSSASAPRQKRSCAPRNSGTEKSSTCRSPMPIATAWKCACWRARRFRRDVRPALRAARKADRFPGAGISRLSAEKPRGMAEHRSDEARRAPTRAYVGALGSARAWRAPGIAIPTAPIVTPAPRDSYTG